MIDDLDVAPIPARLRFDPQPVSAELSAGSLGIEAGPRTDLFVDPLTGRVRDEAPRALGLVSGDFLFSARVRADHRSTFDAGALLAVVDGDHWAKLCLERSPQGVPMVVSVINRGVCDDANAFDVDGGAVWLRIARRAWTVALHASLDGRTWQLIRHCSLAPPNAAAPPGEMRIGFLAQSPTGPGCRAAFDDIRFAAGQLTDLRDGS